MELSFAARSRVFEELRASRSPAGPWRLVVVASGTVGLAVVERLAREPFDALVVLPLFSADHDLLKSRTFPGLAEVTVASTTFASLGSPTLVLQGHRGLLWASSRPHPRLELAVNRESLKLGLTWTRITVDGTALVLGPTVAPGETSCFQCYQLRLAARRAQPELQEAERRLLDDDPDLDWPLPPLLVELAATYGAAEALRLIDPARPAPLALGREVFVDLLRGTELFSDVIPVEACPACASRQRPPRGVTLREVVARRLERRRKGTLEG